MYPQDTVKLARQAGRFLIETVRFRAALDAAWAETIDKPADDWAVFVQGSVARYEATANSDVDFLVVAPRGADLPGGSIPVLTKVRESRRVDEMMRQPWVRNFLNQLNQLGYVRAHEYCFAFGVDEFSTARMPAQSGAMLSAYARYGANLLYASVALSDSPSGL